MEMEPDHMTTKAHRGYAEQTRGSIAIAESGARSRFTWSPRYGFRA